MCGHRGKTSSGKPVVNRETVIIAGRNPAAALSSSLFFPNSFPSGFRISKRVKIEKETLSAPGFGDEM